MPGVNGIEVARPKEEARPRTPILQGAPFALVAAAVFASLAGGGARGYVLKDTKEEEMIRAIRAVGNGEAIFSPAIASRLMDFFAAPRPAVPKELFPTLTEREREILQLIAQGSSNTVIAQELA